MNFVACEQHIGDIRSQFKCQKIEFRMSKCDIQAKFECKKEKKNRKKKNEKQKTKSENKLAFTLLLTQIFMEHLNIFTIKGNKFG